MTRAGDRIGRARLILTVYALSSLCLSGCGSFGPSETERSAAEPRTGPAPPAGPAASVQIDYATRGDYLESLSVSKFVGASLLAAKAKAGRGRPALVRFEGGTPVWEIRADKGISGGLLTLIPGGTGSKRFALSSVRYAELPPGFVQTIPQEGSPEPLQPGFYYVFSVRRASGSLSCQAIRVASDGAIEAYDAEPMVGTSYELCCDLSPGFASPVESAAPARSGL